MIKSKLSLVVVTLSLVLSMTSICVANPVEKEVVDITVDKAETGEYIFKSDNSKYNFTSNTEEYNTFVNSIKQSVQEDAVKGLEELATSKVAKDNIKLEVWGEYLNKYYLKQASNFPTGPIDMSFEDITINFTNNKDGKEWLIKEVHPIMLEGIKEESLKYPVVRYSLDILQGVLLKDYTFDATAVREVNRVLPLDGIEDYIIYNTGAEYGLTINGDYVSILRGYLEGNSGSYEYPVEGEYPGCVNVLAYVTMLKNIEGNTLSDKEVTDFTLYKDLAVRLDTKEIIDTTLMTTTSSKNTYTDYKLNYDTLILTPIESEVVIVQPTYLECFTYGGYDKNFGRTIDVTPFVIEGSPNVNVTDGKVVESVPISYFADANNNLSTKLGKSPFLIYYSSHIPYDLLIDWGYNKAGNTFEDATAQDKFISKIEQDMKNQGMVAEFKKYSKEAGHSSGALGIVLFILVVGAIGGIVFFKIKKKNKTVLVNNTDVLFVEKDPSEISVNDDDLDFEIKG